jgi:hypothetical protein
MGLIIMGAYVKYITTIKGFLFFWWGLEPDGYILASVLHINTANIKKK